MALAAFVLLVSVAGAGLSEVAWRRLEGGVPPLLERTLSGCLAAWAVSVAVTWALLLPGALSAGSLLGGAAAVALPAGFAWYASRADRHAPVVAAAANGRDALSPDRVIVVLALVPLFGWLAFVAWRGWLLPPLSEDGLIYHLPRALFLAREGGFRPFPATDIRLETFPANYEALLADVLLLAGADRVTEWVSTAGWVGFSLAGAAFAERWWGRGLHTVASALVVAGSRVALLQSGAHKHDVLAAFFSACAILWTARWASAGGRMPAALALVALALAAGTKVPTGPVVVTCLAAGAWAAARRWRAGERPAGRDLVALGTLGLACALLLGGVAYAENLVRFGSFLGPNPTGAAAVLAGRSGREWSGLLLFPLLQVAAPFAGGNDVTLPFGAGTWWWPQDDLNLSHLGLLVSVLALALPACLLRYGRVRTGEGTPRERAIAAVVAAVAFCAPGAARMPIPGSYAFCARYVLFVVPLIAALTLAPVIRELSSASQRERRVARFVVLSAALFFSREAVHCALHDAFAPLSYVREVARNPGSRRPFRTPGRAAVVADELAGPTDVIAFDAGHDSWIYPAFGASLSRRVLFFARGGTRVPDEARFVVVDRYENVLWGHPGFRHMSTAGAYLGRGTPSEDELRVFRAVSADPRFELVYRDARLNQAVFVRRSAADRSLPGDRPSGRP